MLEANGHWSAFWSTFWTVVSFARGALFQGLSLPLSLDGGRLPYEDLRSGGHAAHSSSSRFVAAELAYW